jgi:predicted TIM-barrel fold metal-dependent hydrolase
MKIIGLEEHFATPEIVKAWLSLDARTQDMAIKASTEGEGGRRLLEIGPERIAAMDDAGIDVQVLSLTTPGVQNLTADVAVDLARASNDLLTEAIGKYPDRFQGFATLPTPAPHVAAKELERGVRELGLQGAMIFGRTGNRNLDHPDFTPVFEAAAALRAPLYLHPQTPQPGVLEAYYLGFNESVDSLFARAGIGWHYETGMQIVRMAVAGVFDRYPDLKIITGHMGEVILFYLDRLDVITGAAKLPRKISDYVKQHVYVTPSGLWSHRYLRWVIEVLGADHVLMATDYPFAETPKNIARTFLQVADLTEEERRKVAYGNWERLTAAVRRG